MQPDLLLWLMNWYRSHCDGDWEHQHGVQIETLDNPGWAVRMDLVGTPLEALELAPEQIQRDEQDWVHVRIRNSRLEGFCGAGNLVELLERFRVIMEAHGQGKAA